MYCFCDADHAGDRLDYHIPKSCTDCMVFVETEYRRKLMFRLRIHRTSNSSRTNNIASLQVTDDGYPNRYTMSNTM
jgi:5S rRNA maturation endonuclease (ribonuclease M5)